MESPLVSLVVVRGRRRPRGEELKQGDHLGIQVSELRLRVGVHLGLQVGELLERVGLRGVRLGLHGGELLLQSCELVTARRRRSLRPEL